MWMQYITRELKSNCDLMKKTLADFSDADMLARPVEQANHAMWQLGHLICSETRLVRAAGGTMPELPPGFEAKFARDTARSDDPASFHTKSEMLTLLSRQRQATIDWAGSLTGEDLARQLPEPMRNFIPDIAALLTVLLTHTAMHVGQMQVIRRKLAKPVLF